MDHSRGICWGSKLSLASLVHLLVLLNVDLPQVDVRTESALEHFEELVLLYHPHEGHVLGFARV